MGLREFECWCKAGSWPRPNRGAGQSQLLSTFQQDCSVDHGFLTSAALIFWTTQSCVMGDCPTHCRLLSSISACDPPDASIIPHPQLRQPKHLWTLQMFSKGKNCAHTFPELSTIGINNYFTLLGRSLADHFHACPGAFLRILFFCGISLEGRVKVGPHDN